MNIQFKTEELDRLVELLGKRADHMVPDALVEARDKAGRPNPNQNYRKVQFLRGRRIARQPVLGSAFQVARWLERVLYKRFIDFFGPW
jgi:hypothetical protein